MTINDIARLITEHPDVNYDRAVLMEAPDAFYLTAFNKAQAPIPAGYDLSHLGFVHGIGFVNPPADARTGGPPTGAMNAWVRPGEERTGYVAKFKDLPQEERLKIIHRVKAIVPPELVKYEPYYMNQVISGNLNLVRMEEDSQRFASTIMGFIKMSRKAAWEGPKDLFKYPNWRLLEREVKDFSDKHIDYDASQDSEVYLTKKYVNNAVSLLLGGPPEVTIYWFRSVTSPEAAAKYGKGTTWCTSSTPEPRGTAGYDQHYAHHYVKSGGLYIIEMQSPTKPRRPILQISGDQFMDVNDVPVSRIGPRLQDFFKEVLSVAGDKIHPETMRELARQAGRKWAQ